jgi:hypothetical protein
VDAVVGRRRDQGQPICQAIFDIGSKFELFIGWNGNEMSLRIKRMGGIRKRRVGNNLSFARRHQPGAAPRCLAAGADEPAGGGNEREGKARDTQRKALPGPGTTMEISKKTVDIAHHILAAFLPNTKQFA